MKRYTRKNKRGGFRYGKSKGHTPIQGEILISAPRTSKKTRTKTRTKSRTRKYFF